MKKCHEHTWLRDTRPHKFDNMSIQVRKIPLEAKKRLVHSDNLSPIKALLAPLEPALLLLAPHPEDDIPGLPVRVLIPFTLENYLVPFGHTWSDFERICLGMVVDFGTGAVGAGFCYYLAFAITLVASGKWDRAKGNVQSKSDIEQQQTDEHE